ncbi:MAG TPA: S49 family peptidase, partial [Alphaproteobacteria bacterium]|nr:S49 family peptidase [Alphaproteobacteria bacterium]
MANFGSLFYKPKKNDSEISAKRWNIPSIIWRAIVKTCTAIGAMILISALISTLLVSFGSKGTPLPDDMVLVFKIEDGVAEVQTRPSLMDPFPFMQPTIRNVIDTLDKAKDDDRVRGLIFSLKGGSMSTAHVQELRAAVARFKKSGKFTKIYSPSYMDGTAGSGQYYLASAFDEIWMQPVGMLSATGANVEMPFAKAALDKIGVKAEFFQREEYKSAMENFTNEHISKANQIALDSMIGNLSSRVISDISLARKINLVDIAKEFDKGLFTGQEALDAGLIDRLDYPDVMVSEIREAATGNPDDESVELVSLARYSQHKTKPHKSSKVKQNVALIYAVGTIVDSAGNNVPAKP